MILPILIIVFSILLGFTATAKKPLLYDFHPNQLAIYRDPHRFKVINAGRRFGKTRFCRIVGALTAMSMSNATGYVVAPTAKRAMRLYKAIIKAIPKEYIVTDSEKWMYIELTNGTTLWCMTAENPDSLPGEGLDFLIIDEAALCKEEAWHVLLPSLIDNPNSVAWIVSTPRGMNWFHDACELEIDDDDFKTFTFTSYDNPTISAKEIDKMVKRLPELVARQEIFAEFIKSGLVFRNLDKIMTADPMDPIPGHDYVIGWDMAKQYDFNVIKVFDTTNNTEVFTQRDNHIDYDFQRASVYEQAKRWNNATIFVDKTGVGEAVVEDLKKMDRAYAHSRPQGFLTVIPVVFSINSKPELYNHYIVMQENNMIWLLKDDDTKKEHRTFEMEKMPSGYMRYAAQKGRHDDTVTACALAAWGLEEVMSSKLIGWQDTMEKPNPEGGVEFKNQEKIADWDESEEEHSGAGVARGHNKIVLKKFYGES